MTEDVTDKAGYDQVATESEENGWKTAGGYEEQGVQPGDEYGEAAREDGADEAQQIEYQEDPQLPYEPKAPPRSQPPEVFSLWRQYMNGSMMTQAVVEDDADTLIWMLENNLVDLSATDELGNTAAHLAVFHDAPRVLHLLHGLGVDLSATCDAAGFGSAIFYSVFLGRVHCLTELVNLGYDMTRPCDRFERTPESVASRHDQGAALAVLRRSLAAVNIQGLFRGFLGRKQALLLTSPQRQPPVAAHQQQHEEEAQVALPDGDGNVQAVEITDDNANISDGQQQKNHGDDL